MRSRKYSAIEKDSSQLWHEDTVRMALLFVDLVHLAVRFD